MKSIEKLFGSMSTISLLNECKEVVSKAMENMKGMQKWCKVLVDEVHIIPAIRHRDNHLIGSSVDDPTTAAWTVLTIMVCSLTSGRSYVALILPIYSINHEILCNTINKVIGIIHEFSGRDFLVVTDNLKANESCPSLP